MRMTPPGCYSVPGGGGVDGCDADSDFDCFAAYLCAAVWAGAVNWPRVTLRTMSPDARSRCTLSTTDWARCGPES